MGSPSVSSASGTGTRHVLAASHPLSVSRVSEVRVSKEWGQCHSGPCGGMRAAQHENWGWAPSLLFGRRIWKADGRDGESEATGSRRKPGMQAGRSRAQRAQPRAAGRGQAEAGGSTRWWQCWTTHTPYAFSCCACHLRALYNLKSHESDIAGAPEFNEWGIQYAKQPQREFFGRVTLPCLIQLNSREHIVEIFHQTTHPNLCPPRDLLERS